MTANRVNALKLELYAGCALPAFGEKPKDGLNLECCDERDERAHYHLVVDHPLFRVLEELERATRKLRHVGF